MLTTFFIVLFQTLHHKTNISIARIKPTSKVNKTIYDGNRTSSENVYRALANKMIQNF